MSENNSLVPSVPSVVPNQDERTMATLAHVLQLVGWWIAPLIIFLLKRGSRFVSFHALQALLLQVLHSVLWGICMVGFVVVMLSTAVQQANTHGPPIALFVAFPLIWLVGVGLWVGILIIAIVYAIKAGRGEWAQYPVLGALALRFLKIGPNGLPQA